VEWYKEEFEKSTNENEMDPKTLEFNSFEKRKNSTKDLTKGGKKTIKSNFETSDEKKNQEDQKFTVDTSGVVDR